MVPDRRIFRIALVVDEIIVAGVALCSIDMAHALAKLGYDVTLVVLRLPKAQIAWQERFTTLVLDPPCSLKALTHILENFDAIIVSNGVAMPFAFEAARFTAKPLLVDWLHGEMKARQCPAVDVAIAVSETIYRSMSPTDVDRYIPNGIDCTRFRPKSSPTSDLVQIIQIAREWKNMQPDLAVLGPQLVRQGLPVEIHVVGKDGPSSPNVTFHGVKRDVTDLLRKADILLHMAHMEPFGMPAIEAMACGVIPVVSNIGGLPISVVDGVTGYVAAFGDRPGVERILVDLIWRMKRNEPSAAKMREAGIRRVRERFDILVTARQIGQYLEEMHAKLPRHHRSTQYPFSFIGPMLDYSLNRTDHYLAAMADVANATDLTEALSNWKEFRNHPEPEWSGVTSETWNFLDLVYSRIVAESAVPNHQRKAVCFYWLAVLALSLKQYKIALKFLDQGCQHSPAGACVLSPISRIGLACSIVLFILAYAKVEIPVQLAEVGNRIQAAYFRNQIAELEKWKLDYSMVEELLRAAEHLEILPLLIEDH